MIQTLATSKFTLLILIFLVVTFYSYPQEPGSGNNLSFDGANDYVDLPSSLVQNFASNFSVSFWVKPSAGSYKRIISRYQGFGGGSPGDFLIDTYSPLNNGRGIRFWISNGSNASFIMSDNALVLNEWNHVSVTFDNGTMTIFVNGSLVTSGLAAFTSLPSSGNLVKIGEDRVINAPEFFQGQIDELSFWNCTLTQLQIRDWMCKKINSTHPEYSNLTGYFKFDNGTGTVLYDSKNGNNGTLLNGPTWTLSGAPIGDENNYDYSSNPSVSLVHPDGDILTINNFSGSPNGVFVYYVNQYPNTLNGTTGVGNNQKYFGVYKLGDLSSTYTATYDYGAYTGIETEADLLLFSRNDNSDQTWVDCGANLDMTVNTMTASGESTEYILGSSGIALPVELVFFRVKHLSEDNVLIEWETASEKNNKGFYLERSEDGVNWKTTDFIIGAGSSNKLIKYEVRDVILKKKVYYFRLIQHDFNGVETELGIRSIDNRTGEKIIKRVNLLGQDVDENYRGIVILYYDNDTCKTVYQ